MKYNAAHLPDLHSSVTNIKLTNVRFVPSEINPSEMANLRFIEKGRIILVQQSRRAFTIDFSSEVESSGKHQHETLSTGEMSKEIAVSTISRETGRFDAKNIAFVDGFNVYIAAGYQVKKGESVWSRPANATKGLARVSLDGGHDISWSRDGRYLFWLLGMSM